MWLEKMEPSRAMEHRASMRYYISMSKKETSRAGRKPRFDDKRKQIYLSALAKTGVIGKAMAACGIKSRATLKSARDQDTDFVKAETEALEAAADLVEAAVLQRGLFGQEVPIVDANGCVVLDEDTGKPRTVFLPPDNKMLLAMAKALRPQKFATERRHVTGDKQRSTVFLPAAVLEDEFEKMLAAQKEKTDAHIKQTKAELRLA